MGFFFFCAFTASDHLLLNRSPNIGHSYLVGYLTNSKIAETKALEPLTLSAAIFELVARGVPRVKAIWKDLTHNNCCVFFTSVTSLEYVR
jgi:hypothetical protein